MSANIWVFEATEKHSLCLTVKISLSGASRRWQDGSVGKGTRCVCYTGSASQPTAPLFMDPAVPACKGSSQLDLLSVDSPLQKEGHGGSWDPHPGIRPCPPVRCRQFCHNCTWPQGLEEKQISRSKVTESVNNCVSSDFLFSFLISPPSGS